MKLTVFRAGKGDCLLLETKDKHLMLIDGGMPNAYSAHVAPTLGALAAKKRAIDVLCVSHIDEDHIGGVLRMIDDAFAWERHRFQKATGGSTERPTVIEPPRFKAIWHNAFHAQVDDNRGDLDTLLAAAASILSGSEDESARGPTLAMAELASSERQAMLLSKRVGADQLNIPLNPDFDGKLILRKGARSRGAGDAEVAAAAAVKSEPIALGAAKVHVLAPGEKQLDELRAQWNAFVTKHRDVVTKIERDARQDARSIGNSELDRLMGPLLSQVDTFGDIGDVTPPNLASLMLLVTEGDRRVLLTGDGHADHVLDGLQSLGLMAGDGDGGKPFHVDVLKVMHHGAAANITERFCERIIADHYIFCGDGSHTNPEPSVVRLITAKRVEDGDDRPFTFHFTCSSSVLTGAKEEQRRKHMQKLEAEADKLRKHSNQRLTINFLADSSFTIPL